LETVKRNSLALEFVKNPTKEMCLIAIENNLESIKIVDKQKFPEIWDKYVIETV